MSDPLTRSAARAASRAAAGAATRAATRAVIGGAGVQPAGSAQVGPQQSGPPFTDPAAAAGRSRRARRPSPGLGDLQALPRRAAVLLVALVVVLAATALAVRASGVLRPDASELPDLPAVAEVVPGVWRSGEPSDADLVRLVSDYGVVAVVDVSSAPDSVASAQARAAARGLGVRQLSLVVPPGGLPPADQVAALGDLLAQRGADGRVLLHDTTGSGPVLVAAAVVALLEGQPVPQAAAAGGGALDAQQLDELSELVRTASTG